MALLAPQGTMSDALTLVTILCMIAKSGSTNGYSSNVIRCYSRAGKLIVYKCPVL